MKESGFVHILKPQRASIVKGPLLWLLLFFLTSCVSAFGQAGAEEIGKVSYYSDKFQGKITASGQLYDKDELTAAHKTLPFGTLLRVTNLKTGNSAIVRINDRGPYAKGRILDVSRAAAEGLDLIRSGEIEAKLEIINIEDLPMAKTYPIETPLPPDPSIERMNDVKTKSPAPIIIGESIDETYQTDPQGRLVTGINFKKEGTYRIELREPTPQTGYLVQTASLTNMEGALKEIARLQQQAPGRVLLITEDGKNGVIFKLAVGPFEEKSDATKMKEKLARKGFPNCFVRKN